VHVDGSAATPEYPPRLPGDEVATERLSMRKTREVLRLKFEVGLSHREVATSLGLSPGTVGKTLSRLESSGLTWEAAQALSEEALEAKLYAAVTATPTRPLPDYARVHAEYRRVGVTLELLHKEHLEDQPGGYGYTQFCEFYRRWLGQRGLTMRQEHKAGEKLFVDYSGKRPHYIDRETGERVDVELFTAVLGASNYVYTEATRMRSGSTASTSASSARSPRQSFASPRPASRTSTTRHVASSIAPWSDSSPRAGGSRSSSPS
jgi:transposase